MEEEDSQNAANSEIRFITLELMRLAQKSGKSFEQIAKEYVQNTCKLQDMISGEFEEAPKRSKHGSSIRQK